ncbi:hypothetical protein NBRC116589_17060 [Ruegeria sp. HU-ET01832]
MDACQDTSAPALDDSNCVHIQLSAQENRTQAANRFMRLDAMESGSVFLNNAQKTAQKISGRQIQTRLSV